jgi:hypothetical protein
MAIGHVLRPRELPRVLFSAILLVEQEHGVEAGAGLDRRVDQGDAADPGDAPAVDDGNAVVPAAGATASGSRGADSAGVASATAKVAAETSKRALRMRYLH